MSQIHPWVITFEEVGALVSGQWFGAINPIGNFIACTEILYRPPPGVT